MGLIHVSEMNRRVLLGLLLCLCALAAAHAQPGSGRAKFFADTSNAYCLYRTYPAEGIPSETAAPEGYEPVYISAYLRHGSRRLHKQEYSSMPRKEMEAGVLTPLGESVLARVRRIDDDSLPHLGELTLKGDAQHRGIAARMYAAYPSAFTGDALVDCRSTVVQRTIFSMMACCETLHDLVPTLQIERSSSASYSYLNNSFYDPYKAVPHKPFDDFIEENLDAEPIISRLFAEGGPSDPLVFIRNLFLCAIIVPGLDLEGVGFLRDAFTDEEIFILGQGMNLMMYTRVSNSPLNGANTMSSQVPLLQDILVRADEALASGRKGADLRFGHDSFLMPLIALFDVNGYGVSEADPHKVIDSFQDFAVAPMAGNLRIVFYRNQSGDVIVKVLLHEREASLPINDDIFPYYHWDAVRGYIIDKINTYQ